MSIAALFTIARTWKQPIYQSAEELIRKLWYMYTMEYYSAIKQNTFESVVMKWMNLEPITFNEVSQKEKDKYCILPWWWWWWFSHQVMSNFCDPMGYSLTGLSVYNILQARILEWVAISFFGGSSQPRNWTWISCIAGRFFTDWATREAPYITISMWNLERWYQQSYMQGSEGDKDVKNRLLDSVGEDESGMIWENSTETCTLP